MLAGFANCLFLMWKLHGDPQPWTNSMNPTSRLAISTSQHTKASLVPYIAFLRRPSSRNSDLHDSCGNSIAMRLRAGLVKCARSTSMNKTHWVLDVFLNTPFSSRNLSVHANAKRNFEQLSGGSAAKNSAVNDHLGPRRVSFCDVATTIIIAKLRHFCCPPIVL